MRDQSDCPIKVFPESADSLANHSDRALESLERYAAKFGVKVVHSGEERNGWKWDGWIYDHPHLSLSAHPFAYVSKRDCICAALRALHTELSDQGFGDDDA